MTLSPEQRQLLQSYMMKNHVAPQAAQAAPVQLPPQSSGGSGGGASLLSTIGGLFDNPDVQGPVQQGEAPLGQSWLSKFADRLDPAAAQQRQIFSQQQSAPQINMQQVMAALAKSGIR